MQDNDRNNPPDEIPQENDEIVHMDDSCVSGESHKKPIIEIKDLVKVFKDTRALDSVSLVVNEGDAFGFIGPNGAGKTTTIKILVTLLNPSEGEACIDGHSVVDNADEVRRIIGYMPDYFGVYDGMKVWEYLDFFASAYKKSSSNRMTMIDDVLEITDLAGKKQSFIETLSKGMRQRLGVAKTLIHDPKILILDEPASGLDPRARIELKELLKALTRMGKTIFISSHILPELSDICNKVGILEAGKLLACGSISEFAESMQSATVRLLQIRTIGEDKKVLDLLNDYPGVVNAKLEANSVMVEFNGSLEEVGRLLNTLIERKIKVVNFSEKSADLEDIFLKVTKGVVV